MSPSNAPAALNASSHNKYIHHQVSKMDTLAGVAIKYGVEVADIKRLNGLATDLQMFALKTLQIPLPGRHPPSPSLSNGSTSPGENGDHKTSSRHANSTVSESFQSLQPKSPKQKVSLAMSSLQNYYGLKPPNHRRAVEGTEMAVYRRGSSDHFDDDFMPKISLQCKCGNSMDSLHPANVLDEHVHTSESGCGDSEKSNEKSVRRRPKAEIDSAAGTPERLLKEANGTGGSAFSPLTGKGFAMRMKSESRAVLATDSDWAWSTPLPVGLGDSIITDGFAGVRKSSSTPSFQEQDNNSSFVWPTSRWSLKSDLQALSSTVITMPLFDGLPKPITGRRSKAALD